MNTRHQPERLMERRGSADRLDAVDGYFAAALLRGLYRTTRDGFSCLGGNIRSLRLEIYDSIKGSGGFGVGRRGRVDGYRTGNVGGDGHGWIELVVLSRPAAYVTCS